MWSMLQVATADDYVVASGTSTSVREFAQAAFEAAGLPLVFEGEGIAETGRHSRTGEILIRVNPKYYRPIDPARLVGNSAKARRLLGWKSRTSGRAVAVAMVESARRESAR
jgi:GDPmannose 4,6-dehydratase